MVNDDVRGRNRNERKEIVGIAVRHKQKTDDSNEVGNNNNDYDNKVGANCSARAKKNNETTSQKAGQCQSLFDVK